MSEIIRVTAGNREESILSEMIGLVDKETMQKIMSAGASHLNKGKITVSMDMVDLYLKKWAESKYDQYILFDRKLEVVEEIDLTMTHDQMDFEITNLCQQYKQYALLLKLFKMSDYISNTFSGFATNAKNKDEEFVRLIYKELYLTKGRRLSTALSEIIQDKGHEVTRVLEDGTVTKAMHTFDIELSKIMQVKTIKGKIHVSINPTDFLMMSTNKHNWKSCMAISPDTTGYNNVVLSKMLDESSVVAYKCGNDTVEYNLDGFKWNYVSMQARYLLAIDKITGSCGIDTGQGGQNVKSSELQKKVLQILMDQVARHCGVKNTWVSNSGKQFPTDKLSYNEGIVLSYSHKPTMEKYKRGVYYDIGVKELVCPHCGKIMTDRGSFICCASK